MNYLKKNFLHGSRVLRSDTLKIIIGGQRLVLIPAGISLTMFMVRIYFIVGDTLFT